MADYAPVATVEEGVELQEDPSHCEDENDENPASASDAAIAGVGFGRFSGCGCRPASSSALAPATRFAVHFGPDELRFLR